MDLDQAGQRSPEPDPQPLVHRVPTLDVFIHRTGHLRKKSILSETFLKYYLKQNRIFYKQLPCIFIYLLIDILLSAYTQH